MTRRGLAGVWILVVGTLGVLLLVAGRSASSLDDPDPAQQRPGFLDAVGKPTLAPRVTPALPSADRRAVVVFVRPQLATALCKSLSGDRSLRNRADVVIVSSAPTSPCADIQTVIDADGRLATGFGMRRPRDRGPPVGYAVVDRAGRIRYRTLDPSVVTGLREVETMVRATP